MISVVIPLYNKEASICNTLQTVLNQSYQDFEIVVVNDGSTDRSVEEAEKVKDSRIRIIHQSNAGVSAARNKGVVESQGEYIAFLDADDEWDKNYLQTQYAMTQEYPACGVFACNYVFKDTQGKITETIFRRLPFEGDNGILTNYFEVASHSNPPLWTSAVMVKKSAIQAVDGFPIAIKSGEDLLTWAKLACHYQIAFTKQVLAIYYVRAEAERSLSDLRRTAPADLKSTKDKVGLELCFMYSKLDDDVLKKQLAQYISFWYKMRASINLNLDYRLATVKCAGKSVFYNMFNLKAYLLILLAILCPRCIIKNILN